MREIKFGGLCSYVGADAYSLLSAGVDGAGWHWAAWLKDACR